MDKAPVFDLEKLKAYADWKLLLFLLLFLNVKLAVKVPAIALIYLLQFDFKFGFSFKNSRLPLFYPMIIAVGMVGLMVNHNFGSFNYLIVFVTGIGFWLMCLLAVHQVKISVDRNPVEVIHQTILLFFIINAAVSALNYASIVWETGALNPYTYQGDHQKYFIGTGDFIKGLTFDTSTTNAVLNAFGVIYFLTRRNALMMLVCMAVLLFTGSNSVIIIALLALAALFILRSTKEQKSLIAAGLMCLVFFIEVISPQNGNYVKQVFKNALGIQSVAAAPLYAPVRLTERPDSALNPNELREKSAMLYMDSLNGIRIKKEETKAAAPVVVVEPKTETGRIIIAKPNIHTAPYQALKTTPTETMPLVYFINKHNNELPISSKPLQRKQAPGKITGMLQTAQFFKTHPTKIIAGDGIGNFSSKIAFKASGLGMVGGYSAGHVYINPDFLRNHLDLYLNYFSRSAGYHSLINSPYSVYDQLLAEYGLLGLIAFAIGYLWFFGKNIKTLTYGLPILFITMAVLFTDYWFEQLSVMVFFELLLFLDIKETSLKPITSHGH